ncbi:MAG: 3'(2'),5'-bisphosphate nucleotidase CysQ [Halioglobus sp.]
MQALEKLVTPLLELSRRAGDAICLHYDSSQAAVFEAKGDDSPLTRADLDSHDILLEGLLALGEDLPVLSEESTQVPVDQRLAWRRYWLVDPLDGTKEFLARTGEFTVNIALIDEHKPILGLLYLPLERIAYLGIPGSGAHCYAYQPDGQWTCRPLQTRALAAGAPLMVLASRRHRGPRLGTCLAWLEQHWGPLQRKNSGSALKFCQLVEGEGDFYPRFTPCCEWDTAAGQALLEAAGGALLGMDGQALRYNCSESLYSPNFYGVGDTGHPIWQQLLANGSA